MRPITFVSDLHLDVNKSLGVEDEFVAAYDNFPGYLILAGDICEYRNFESFFFPAIKFLFEVNSAIQIFFVAGNHEFYGGTLPQVKASLRKFQEDNYRFYYLDNGGFFSGVNSRSFMVRGSTLWYPNTPDSWILQNNISDFNQIENFTPIVAHEENALAKKGFSAKPLDLLNIWVIHHLPSYKSVHPKFKGDRLHCYFVDPDFEKIIEEQQPDIVIHGHSHHSVQYYIGRTLVVSNPHGYGKKENPDFDWYKHIFWI